MPAAGTSLTHGPRHNVVDRTLWKEYMKSTGNNVSYEMFTKIIFLSGDKIRERGVNNISGYKLSEGMGYLVTTRYKPKLGTKSLDYKKTRELGCKVFHTNFHSFGYKPRIMWLTSDLAICKHLSIYKFMPERKFSRAVAKNVLEGKVYNEYTYDHFRSRKIRLSLDI